MNVELRPLGLGEILDRTFQLYRARFVLFLGIAATSTLLELLWSALQLGEGFLLKHSHLGSAQQVITTVTVIAAWAINFGAAALSSAAINRAVLAIYEGKPTGIVAAYSAVRGRWITCVWVNIVAFFIAWSPIILLSLGAVLAVVLASSAKNLTEIKLAARFVGAAVFIAFPFCVWISLRYSLAIPACIQEGIGTLHSLKRSVRLSQETRGRIFVLLLIGGFAWFIILMVLMSPTFALVEKHKGQMATSATVYTLAVAFLASTLIKPLFGIGLTLFYYDSRIRKEGYDVEWMLEHSAQPQSLVSAEPLSEGSPASTGIAAG